MSDQNILYFDAEQATRKALVGGKGANLALMTQAGFTVPSGFCVTTHAYSEFLNAAGLDAKIESILNGLDFQGGQLDGATKEIRGLIEGTDFPERLAAEVVRSYRGLGQELFVAVRSSGTAEDLAEASFAGMHDTYLDIRGDEALLRAVRACWASLWTARATSYRHAQGFEQLEARICVVVQSMVSSDVSGVMFTGNPMTTANDEIVINASWGLGEAIVSGIVTPDEFLVRSGDLSVKRRRIGTKSRQVVRDHATGSGTIVEDVPDADQDRPSLTDDQLTELAGLGRRITDHYDGIPQDIEWAFAGGELKLLQSRPITGVEFSWDDEVNSFQTDPEDDDAVFVRSFADELWTGAVTPLMFSMRGDLWQRGYSNLCTQLDLHDAAKMWVWRFHKAEVFYNSKMHRIIVERACPPPFRAGLVDKLPPADRDEALAAPFSYLTYARKYLKGQFLDPRAMLHRWLGELNKWPTERYEEASGLPPEQLARLSDRELQRYIDRMIDLEGEEYLFLFPWFVFGRDAVSLLMKLVADWYDGDNAYAAAELMTGLPKRTIAADESIALWQFAQRIHGSEHLMALFQEHRDGEFFAALEQSEEGRSFLADYQVFARSTSHRGHGDRDFYYPRRAEDPSIDYRAFSVLMGTSDPEVKEHAVNARRAEVFDEVVANIRRKPLGAIRVEILKAVNDYALKFLMVRDNERSFPDRTTFTIKLGFLELNRRLRERGLLDTERDFYFLTKTELYELCNHPAGRNTTLLQAKIAARARDFDRFNAKEVQPPAYLQGNTPVDLDTVLDDNLDGVFRGLGTSRGTVTATARIAKSLSEIDRLKEGDILICNSTDPGWTPVFHVVGGIVGETGGMLAHFSCLSREYGLPAVQLGNALKLIPDGATITINGDTGQVQIHDEVAESAQLQDA